MWNIEDKGVRSHSEVKNDFNRRGSRASLGREEVGGKNEELAWVTAQLGL